MGTCLPPFSRHMCQEPSLANVRVMVSKNGRRPREVLRAAILRDNFSEMKQSVHSTLGMGRTWGPMPKYGRCGAAADVESGRRPSTITGRTQSRKATWTLCTCQPAVPACFNRPRCFGISLSKPIFEGSGRNLCTRKRKPLKATCESSHDRTNYRLRSRGVEEEMATRSFGGCSISKRAPLIRGK